MIAPVASLKRVQVQKFSHGAGKWSTVATFNPEYDIRLDHVRVWFLWLKPIYVITNPLMAEQTACFDAIKFAKKLLRGRYCQVQVQIGGVGDGKWEKTIWINGAYTR